MSETKTKDSKRLGITMNADTFDYLEKSSRKLGLSKSQFIALLLNEKKLKEEKSA